MLSPNCHGCKMTVKFYLGQGFGGSSPGPPRSPCSSHSCLHSLMRRRSPAAPSGSFWTKCSGILCRPLAPSARSSLPWLQFLGCTWLPCLVYPCAICALAASSFFCQWRGGEKKEIKEKAALWIVWTARVLVSKQHLPTKQSQLSNVWRNTSVTRPRSLIVSDQTPSPNDHGDVSENSTVIQCPPFLVTYTSAW